MASQSDSGELDTTTADEVERSSKDSADDDDDSTTDTDSNHGGLAVYEAKKVLTPKEGKKYGNGLVDDKKLNVQSDTETKNLLDDVGEDLDEDYLNLQESEIDLDAKMFELSEEQLNYYSNCFLYLLEKTQGFATLQGAIQGTDRAVLDFFRKSRLDDLSLSRIWSLSDINEDGFLNYQEFLTAMHLVVLHIKANVPIPMQLPRLARPPTTPTRSLIHFDNGHIGAFPDNSLPDSTSNSSTKVVSECISSSSGNSQLLVGAGAVHQQQIVQIGGTHPKSLAIPKALALSSAAPSFPVDMSSTAKQHSFSDDHLHSSTSSAQRDMAVATKFSDVPPLLVDSQPTALNATTSQVLPEFAQLLASTQRGPPPKPPYRDYNNGSGGKGHGRSVSLDLKTFSALSTDYPGEGDHGADEPDGLAHPNVPNTSTPELLVRKKQPCADKSIQTAPTTTSTTTQTISTGTDELSEADLAMCMRDLDTSRLSSPKERCLLLQRVNEQLELERSTLMQVRLQVQLRIEEAEQELKQQPGGSTSPRSGGRGSKPTLL